MAAVQLPPVPQPIGIFQDFIARQPETLVLKEKVLSLSGDSYDIKLMVPGRRPEDGQPIVKVQGSVMSLSGRKGVYNMANQHMFDIQKELLHLHTTFAGNNPQGQKIFEVKSSFALLGSKATATFTSYTGKAETLKMKGNFWDSTADIVDESTGAVVAQINRQFLNAGELLFGQQTYALTVAPGVDMVLMAAMCICLDEKKNEGGGGLLG